MGESFDLEPGEHFTQVTGRSDDGWAWRLLADTGIGLTVVSPALAAHCGAVPTGEWHSGCRMSGQVVSAPLYDVPALELLGTRFVEVRAALLDLGQSTASPLGAVVGLDLLGAGGFWVDPGDRRLGLGKAPFDVVGSVEVEVRRAGPAVTTFVDLTLPSGRTVGVEVDSGSDGLVLDRSLADDCGIPDLDDPADPSLRHEHGTDETGHVFHRVHGRLQGEVFLTGQPATAQMRPQAMFQDIIHPGLLGASFLNRGRWAIDTSRAVLELG